MCAARMERTHIFSFACLKERACCFEDLIVPVCVCVLRFCCQGCSRSGDRQKFDF